MGLVLRSERGVCLAAIKRAARPLIATPRVGERAAWRLAERTLVERLVKGCGRSEGG